MMVFPVGTSGQAIILTNTVLAHFRRHRQNQWWRSEAGGQLFARFDGGRVLVEEATGPRSGDRRGRNFYHPDQRAEQCEIDARHRNGFNYVGDWHTHPEAQPVPSASDLASIAESVRRSAHGLGGFILVVVGTEDPPGGLHLSVHDGHSGFRLRPGRGFPAEACPAPGEVRRTRIVWV